MPSPRPLAPTVNVVEQKNATTLIVGVNSYRNAIGIITSCISITFLKKNKKKVMGDNFFKPLGDLI